MTTRTTIRTAVLPRLMELFVQQYPTARATLVTRLADHDGYPTQTIGASPPTGRSPNDGMGDITLTATESAVNARQRIVGRIDGLDRTMTLLATHLHDGLALCDEAMRGSTRITADRCNGKIDPTCRNVPTEPNGLCVDCLPHACPRCRRNPTAERRIDGVLVCESCARQDRRERQVP